MSSKLFHYFRDFRLNKARFSALKIMSNHILLYRNSMDEDITITHTIGVSEPVMKTEKNPVGRPRSEFLRFLVIFQQFSTFIKWTFLAQSQFFFETP